MSKPPPSPPPGRGPAPWFNYASSASVGIEIVVVFLMFTFGGYWLERNVTHWSPWTAMIGMLFGLLGASMVIVRLVREHNAAMAAKADDERAHASTEVANSRDSAVTGEPNEANTKARARTPSGTTADPGADAAIRQGAMPTSNSLPADPAFQRTTAPTRASQNDASARRQCAQEIAEVEAELDEALQDDDLPAPLRTLLEEQRSGPSGHHRNDRGGA